MAKKRVSKNGDSRGGHSVYPVDITSYDGDNNSVSFTKCAHEGEALFFEGVAWGSVKAPLVGGRYLCRIESRKRVPIKLSPLKHVVARDKQVLAVAERHGKGFRFFPIERNLRKVFSGASDVCLGVKDGDLLSLVLSGNRVSMVERNYGSVAGVFGLNKLSLLQGGIEESFSDDILAAARSFGSDDSIVLEAGQEDCRDVPFVTIDGADAKDFDDAVFAEPHVDGGFRLVVAIADVGFYVGEGSLLDFEARRRGNSIYLSGMVVPMLPFELSAGLCSLRPFKARHALAVEVHIGADGEILDYIFKRILMSSHARLIYEDVDKFFEGGVLSLDSVVLDSLGYLRDLYLILSRRREERGSLEIISGDRRVELDNDGVIVRISTMLQTESRKLIEEMMIAANICAARFLMYKGLFGMHRNHEFPPSDKVGLFADIVESLGYRFKRGGSVRVKDFNAISRTARSRGEGSIIEGLILRSQSQAYYSPRKCGHFGLGLDDYCHFTSPIRRYADLLVHRAISCKLSNGVVGLGLSDLELIGQQISDTERSSMVIERSSMDRVSALYLDQLLCDDKDRSLCAIVRSVTDFAIFVYIDEVCGDAILPFGSLPRDYYKLLDNGSRLLGCDGGLVLKLGDELEVRCVESNSYAGRIAVEYISGGSYIDKKEARKLSGKRDFKGRGAGGRGGAGKPKFKKRRS